jgi:hypothetical protein
MYSLSFQNSSKTIILSFQDTSAGSGQLGTRGGFRGSPCRKTPQDDTTTDTLPLSEGCGFAAAPSICKGRAFCISPGAADKGPIPIYGRGLPFRRVPSLLEKSPTLENREGRAPANSKPPQRLSHPPSEKAHRQECLCHQKRREILRANAALRMTGESRRWQPFRSGCVPQVARRVRTAQPCGP